MLRYQEKLTMMMEHGPGMEAVHMAQAGEPVPLPQINSILLLLY
jgi:hypothetical protein